MIPASLFSELMSLSVPERIDLVEALRDSIAEDADAVPLTDWQRLELDTCLKEYQGCPDDGETWEQVKAGIDA